MIDIKVSVLNSGSNGNSVFVKSNKTRLLFDAGLSGKQIAERLAYIGEDISKVDALFVSHEHVDHTRGVGVLARRLNLPIYMSEDTFENCQHIVGKIDNLMTLKHNKQISIEDLKIKSFNLSHDASDTCGFIVENEKKLGIMTDLGYGCENAIKQIGKLNAVVLESNHDVDMLMNGRYPYFLKQRISSNHGHLSNIDCAKLIDDYASNKLENIFLAHLSQDNNTPDTAMNTFKQLTNNNDKLHKLKTHMTSRLGPTKIFDV
ncbi:MBL fold metallo-hydrolase [Nanoarchaeota archaeon]